MHVSREEKNKKYQNRQSWQRIFKGEKSETKKNTIFLNWELKLCFSYFISAENSFAMNEHVFFVVAH